MVDMKWTELGKQGFTSSDTVSALLAALVKAQAKIGRAARDAANPFFRSKYATLEEVWDTVRGPLQENGLAVIQLPSGRPLGAPVQMERRDKKGNAFMALVQPYEVTVQTTLVHESGEWIATPCSCVVEDGAAQPVGSATSYLRRYGLAAVGMVTFGDDDDGEQAMSRPAPRPKKTPQEEEEERQAEHDTRVSLLDQIGALVTDLEGLNKWANDKFDAPLNTLPIQQLSEILTIVKKKKATTAKE